MKQQSPYVHIVHSSATRVETGVFAPSGVVYSNTPGHHALVAARVQPERYEVLAERKWGWIEGDLLDEIQDRVGRFIACQHDVGLQSVLSDVHLRTLGLRYVSSGDSQQLDIILISKVFAPEREAARALALNWFEEISLLLPHDYGLVPLVSQQEFMRHSGQALLEAQSALSAEIRRFETFRLRPRQEDVQETDYLVYPFLWHRHAMEQVWQVMASHPAPAVVSMTLRPAYLYEAEEFYLGQLYEAATEAANSENAAERILGEQATSIYAEYLRSWKHPFLARVQITASEKIPPALARVTGCALAYGSGSGQENYAFPGYEVLVPDADEGALARENACLLEMNDWGRDQAAPPYRRFRYLTDVKGARCVFQLPFVPKEGIPGVLIRQGARHKES